MMMRRTSVLGFAVLATVLVIGPSLQAAAEQRVALVIGNNAYDELGRLNNPVNDAKLMARSMRALGFEVVEHTDADEKAMKRAIQDFGRRIERAGRDTVSVFYYAGHGLQVNGINYLVPIKARIQRATDVAIEAVDASLVLHQMEDAGSRVNIMILDACRNNPLPRGLRSTLRGLATMNAPQGSLIAYSTAPESVSMDGEGENSPYTLALARTMAEPGLAAEEVFRQVRVRVLEATRGEQRPWESSSLTTAFYFSSPPAVAGGSTSAPQEEVKAPANVPAPEQVRQPPPTRVEPVPILPPPQVGDGIAGRWEGRYQCQHDEIGFFLDIANGEGNRISAVFEFFPLPGMLSIPRGSFRMLGDYNSADGSIRLQSAGWIKRPLGFQSHDIEGQLAAHGRGISGRVLTTGCAHFVLTRK
jgi:Caspase domain